MALFNKQMKKMMIQVKTSTLAIHVSHRVSDHHIGGGDEHSHPIKFSPTPQSHKQIHIFKSLPKCRVVIILNVIIQITCNTGISNGFMFGLPHKQIPFLSTSQSLQSKWEIQSVSCNILILGRNRRIQDSTLFIFFFNYQ